MRLTIVTPAAPPALGGGASWFLSLLTVLSRDHAVLAVVPDDADVDAIRSVGARTIARYAVAPVALVGHTRDLVDTIIAASREFGSELVHLADAGVAFLATEIESACLPVVVTVRGPELDVLSWPGGLDFDERMAALWRGVAAARAVGTSNPAVLPNERVARLRPAVDLERFAPGDQMAARRSLKIDEDRPVLLTLGRLGLDDGHLAAVAALARLTEQRPLYVIGGDSEAAGRVADRVRFYNLTDDVVLAGPVPPFALPRLYQAADLFLLPARDSPDGPYSGCGTALLEAAACGVPVLATRVGVLPELVQDGITGLLLDAPEPESLAQAICSLCTDPERRRAFGRAARARVEANHSLARLADDLAGLYARASVSQSAAAPRAATVRSTAPSRIAVFMPTRRCRPWLPRAIDSVLAQSFPHVDLYVVDDASGDVDGELMGSYPSVTFLRMRERTGPYGIVNRLLALTDSEYVAFHDSDDWSTPDRLAVQVDYLDREDFEGCGSWVRLADLNGDPIGFETMPGHASLAMRRDAGDRLMHPSSIFRRRIFNRLGGFDDSTRFSADTEFHFRAALAVELGNVQRFLYNRVVRPDSLTQHRETGLGSEARSRYLEPIRTAFLAVLAGQRAMPDDNVTLSGRPIGRPDISCIAWLRPAVASNTLSPGCACIIPLVAAS